MTVINALMLLVGLGVWKGINHRPTEIH